jgi:hypothetical protein
MFGHIRIIDMMIEQSESLELDLRAKNKSNRTGYQLAKVNGRTDVVNLIQTKMPSLVVHEPLPMKQWFMSSVK